MSSAKSMAMQFANAKRANNSSTQNNTKLALPRTFKSIASNGGQQQPAAGHKQHRLKSTSMSNLMMEEPPVAVAAASGVNSTSTSNLMSGAKQRAASMQRPASRNALDSIHMGMNAKYANVQSKVLLQNIRPTGAAPAPVSPAAASRPAAGATKSTRAANRLTGGSSAKLQQPERAQLAATVARLEAELEETRAGHAELRAELDQAKAERADESRQLRLELEQKAREHEKQVEEYHQKLLEAYELADSNRRAADNLLAESRQRDEEQRKRIEELELQLAELKDFVQAKEEMANKMVELREQLREERERYEEKTRSMNQMFESEKISPAPAQTDSNYFRRVRPPLLQSAECLASGAEPSGRAGARQHQSTQDIYGSKLSTRVKDRARGAWKASRRFASSVVSSGVSACRRRLAASLAKRRARTPAPQFTQSATEFATCALAAHQQEQQQQQQQQLQEHTSVVEVCRRNIDAADQPPTTSDDDQPPHSQQQQVSLDSSQSRVATRQAEIHVDENNKLTIVTKFSANEPNCQQPRSQSQSPSGDSSGCRAPISSSSACSSERCASSSSGRGTSEETTHGDASEPEENSDRMRDGHAHTLLRASDEDAVRGERRASAAKVFAGSQANQLKSFFVAAAAVSMKPQQQQQADDDNNNNNDDHHGGGETTGARTDAPTKRMQQVCSS